MNDNGWAVFMYNTKLVKIYLMHEPRLLIYFKLALISLIKHNELNRNYNIY